MGASPGRPRPGRLTADEWLQNGSYNLQNSPRVSHFPVFPLQFNQPGVLSVETEPDVIRNTNRPMWHIRFRHGLGLGDWEAVEFLNWLRAPQKAKTEANNASPRAEKCTLNSSRCGQFYFQMPGQLARRVLIETK